MFPTKSIFTGFIFSLLFIGQLLAAPVAKITPTPSWVLQRTPDANNKIKERDISNGYYIYLYDEQVNVATETKYYRSVRQITNETGVQNNSEVTVSFSSSYQKLYFHQISIIRDGKKIDKLSKADIKVINEEPGLSEFQIYDYSQAIIILDDVRKGDQLDIEYSLTGFNPIYGKFDYTIGFASYTPILNHYTSVLMPNSRKLLYTEYNKAPQPQITKKDGLTIFDWPVIHVKAYKSEGNTPGWYRDHKYVELSEYNNWEEVAKWATAVMDNQQRSLPDGLKKKITEWKKAANGSDTRFAEKALRFVQDDIRYLGIEVGTYTHQPHEPARTFNNRYGDCKDKALLLATILRSENIPAEMVLVNTTRGEHIAEELPSSGTFNHVILRMHIGDETYYVDPTMTQQGGRLHANYLPHYGKGLVVSNQTQALTDIPYNNNGSTRITETFDIKYDEPSTLEVTTIYKGKDADNIRSTLSYQSMSDMEDAYENYYKNLYTAATLSGEIGVDDNRQDNILTVTEAYNLDSLWEKEDNIEKITIFCRTVYDRLTTPDNDAPNKPLYLAYPTDIRHDIDLIMPEEWGLSDKPYTFKTDDYSFSFKGSTITPTMINLQYEFKTYNDHISPEDLSTYKKHREKMLKSMSYEFSRDTKLSGEIENMKASGTSAKTNWIMVFIALITAGGTFYYLYKKNKTAPTNPPIYAGERINGWLALLAFVVTLRPIVYIYNIYTSEYFSTEHWMILNTYGNTALQLFLLIETIIVIAFFVLSCWVVYWMYNRRDIFIRYFVIMAVAELGYNIIALILGIIFSDTINALYPDFTATMGKAVLKSGFFCALWVTAVLRSDKARSVFSKPYLLVHEPIEDITEPEPDQSHEDSDILADGNATTGDNERNEETDINNNERQ